MNFSFLLKALTWSFAPQIFLRAKGQVTIPSTIFAQWNAQADDLLDVQLANGVVMFTPVRRHQASPDLMAFACLGKGLWGDTPEQVEASNQNLRETWNR